MAGVSVEDAERSMLPAFRVAEVIVTEAVPETVTTPAVAEPLWVFAAAKVSDPSAAPPVRSMITSALTTMCSAWTTKLTPGSVKVSGRVTVSSPSAPVIVRDARPAIGNETLSKVGEPAVLWTIRLPGVPVSAITSMASALPLAFTVTSAVAPSVIGSRSV